MPPGRASKPSSRQQPCPKNQNVPLFSRVLSKGGYGRTREITIDASDDVVDKLYAAAQMNFDLGR